MVREVMIFHRGLGTDDESASNSESHERVLFHFAAAEAADACPPPEHDDRWAEVGDADSVEREQRRQLSTLSLLEGLIEFAKKFSGEEDVPAQTVRMRERTWSLVQAEPGVWVALCIGNAVFQQRKAPSLVDRPGFDLRRFTSLDGDAAAEAAAVAAATAAIAAREADDESDSGGNSGCSNNVDTACLEYALRRLHGLFVCINATVGDVLSGAPGLRQRRSRQQPAADPSAGHTTGPDGDLLGWERIERVKDTRKKLRKLGQRLEQLERDVESARGGDTDRAGLASEVVAVRGDMAAAQAALAALLCRGAVGADALYTPTVLRRRWARLVHWCVRTGALLRWIGASTEPDRTGAAHNIAKMASFSGGHGSSNNSVASAGSSSSSNGGGVGQMSSPARNPKHASSAKTDTASVDAAALAHAQGRVAAARTALEHTLRAVSYLVRYHHASRGAVVLHEDTLLHSDLDDATTALLCELVQLHATAAPAASHLFQPPVIPAGALPAKKKSRGMLLFSLGRPGAAPTAAGGGGAAVRADRGAGFVSGDWSRFLDLTRLPASRDAAPGGGGSSAGSVNSVTTGMGTLFFGHPHQASPMRPPAPGADDPAATASVASTPAKGGAGSALTTPLKDPAGALLLPDDDGDVAPADDIWCRRIYKPRERTKGADPACGADEIGRLVVYARKR